MSSLRNLSVRPLFYDALSGLFTPESDPLGRQHTLARLSVATCIKGDEVKQGVEYGERLFTYAPSWAPRVVSSVVCIYGTDDSPLMISSLHLKSKSDEELEVFDIADGNSLTVVESIDQVQEEELPLDPADLGALTLIQEKIAKQAEAYFLVANASFIH